MKIPKKLSKKTLLFIMLPVVLLLAAGSIAYAQGELPFTDIDGHWAQDSIVKLAEQGIVAGHADGTFGPDESVTRAQVVTFLDRFQTKNSCTQCHNDGSELTSKDGQWGHSVHGEGEVWWEERGRPTCAGCHEGAGFSAMVAAGQNPSASITADDTPIDCRACHAIHVAYDSTDWALETTAAVALYALPGNTYNGGAGNLCANCHEPRTAYPAAVDGMVTVGARFGPHHGPEAALLLGIGGAGLTGSPMFHYTAVADTCVGCHMGSEADHTFTPEIAACTPCHAGAEDFDIGGTQTTVQGMLDELKTALTTAGLLNADGGIVAGSYPEAQAAALWNYVYITDDKSLGVHNPAYSIALLQASLDGLAQ